MSAKQTHIVRKFLNAIEHPLWTVKAISRTGGTHSTWTEQAPTGILKLLQILGRMNFDGCDIFVQPETVGGLYQVINVDDIAKSKYKTLIAAGASAIVQTSENNLQGWFRLASPVPKEHALFISQHLCATFQGDRVSAANVNRAGRLPAFSNCKPGKPLERGKLPFVVLLRARALTIPPLPIVGASSIQAPPAKTGISTNGTIDRSRRDFADACRMAENGASIEQIDAWLSANSEKGANRPDYCQLTATNAYNHVADKNAKCVV